MDPELQAKIDEAKAAGYTDEDIQQYLEAQGQPLTAPTQNKRSEEYTGMGQFGAAKAAEYGLGGYGAYKIGQGLVNTAGKAFAKAPAAPAPTTFTGGANAAWDAALAKPYSPPTAGNFIERMSELASKYGDVAKRGVTTVAEKAAPVARAMAPAALGASLMAYSPSLGPQVPAAGPARGSELNPSTGRPWTKQELQAYNSQY